MFCQLSSSGFLPTNPGAVNARALADSGCRCGGFGDGFGAKYMQRNSLKKAMDVIFFWGVPREGGSENLYMYCMNIYYICIYNMTIYYDTNVHIYSV